MMRSTGNLSLLKKVVGHGSCTLATVYISASTTMHHHQREGHVNQPYVWDTQERPRASCACFRKDRKRAGVSRSGTSHATQHGWSSLAQAAPPAGWQKMQALSKSSVAVLVERRSSHCLPEAHHVDPNVSTAIQVSTLLHDFADS